MEEKCREDLIKMVEAAGLYLQTNSVDIVGNLNLTNDFNINIDFCDYDGMLYKAPKVEIRQTHFVSNPA